MHWILVFAGLLLATHSGSGLECYTCSSHVGITNSMNDCERFNSYENHRKSFCQPGEQVCAKHIVNHDGVTWVHRSCRPYDVCDVLSQMYRNGRDQLLECSTCSDRNLCNSSFMYSASTAVTMFLFILAIY
ncbi:hypothetical protein HUJ04_007336 [Dendroctonus ponderosae]|uniref:Protein sleepless n=1 Tax=Dendroctonus ponderosae TaxID=77166 RepID=A0AAR5QIG7_DENPD|nr:hypothetical protein HUJ04_007336 [Dendroctonus ponderosae]